MKKIVFCLAAILMFAACNNNVEKQINNEVTQTETMTTDSGNEDSSEWTKQSTIMANKPMVVDFYATWCGPCKELAPILDEIEGNHNGEIIFKRVDVDQEPDLAQEFNVQAIPTLLFITPKGEYQSIMGLQSPEVIEGMIQSLLKRSAK